MPFLFPTAVLSILLNAHCEPFTFPVKKSLLLVYAIFTQQNIFCGKTGKKYMKSGFFANTNLSNIHKKIGCLSCEIKSDQRCFKEKKNFFFLLSRAFSLKACKAQKYIKFLHKIQKYFYLAANLICYLDKKTFKFVHTIYRTDIIRKKIIPWQNTL